MLVLANNDTKRTLTFLNDALSESLVCSSIWYKLEKRLRYMDEYGEKDFSDPLVPFGSSIPYGERLNTKVIYTLALQGTFSEAVKTGKYNFYFSVQRERNEEMSFWFNGALMLHSPSPLDTKTLYKLHYAGKTKEVEKDPNPFTLEDAEKFIENTSWSSHT